MSIRRLDEAIAASTRIADRLPPNARAEVSREAEASIVRRDMVMLLVYVRDNRVIGTKSTGNLPLKAVYELAARFVYPMNLEETIHGHTYRARSEDEVWPLHYLHILADVGGLVNAGRARQWRLKRQGEKFLAAQPPAQTLFLLSTWWYRVNWLVAYPYTGMGDRLPPLLPAQALANLRTLPVKKRIAFPKFADQLISDAVLTWTAQDSSFAQMALRSAVQRMIINILAGYGAVKLEYRDKPLGKGTIKELTAFKVTPFGQHLLDALAR